MIKRIANSTLKVLTRPFRRVPERWWVRIIQVTAAAVVLFVIFMLFSISAQTRNAQLQGREIARANGRHIDCLAELFAKYTREQNPILKADLDKCQITEGEAATLLGPDLVSGAVDFTAPPSSEASAPQKTPSTNSTTNLPATKNENTTSNQTPTPAPEPVQILGVPVCVPLTGICVR